METHTHTHARTHRRTHARTHAHTLTHTLTHTHTHTTTDTHKYIQASSPLPPPTPPPPSHPPTHICQHRHRLTQALRLTSQKKMPELGPSTREKPVYYNSVAGTTTLSLFSIRNRKQSHQRQTHCSHTEVADATGEKNKKTKNKNKNGEIKSSYRSRSVDKIWNTASTPRQRLGPCLYPPCTVQELEDRARGQKQDPERPTPGNNLRRTQRTTIKKRSVICP